jgi:hypothetical protein
MKERRIVNEKLNFQIKFGETYKPSHFCTWGELIKTEGVLPTDFLDDLRYEETLESVFGNMSCEDERKTLYIPTVTVIRPRLENDDEYFKRMKEEADRDKQNEIREKNEYLRLKAKYEK